jgi:hypothetical protein
MTKKARKNKNSLVIIGWSSFLGWMLYSIIFARVDGYSLLEDLLQKPISIPQDPISYIHVAISSLPLLLFAYGLSASIVSTRLYKNLGFNTSQGSGVSIWVIWVFVFLLMLYGFWVTNFGYNFSK